MSDLRTTLEAVAIGGLVTTEQLAEAFGSKAQNKGRAGRDWLQKRKINYKRDGRTNWVRVADVLRYVENLPLQGAPAPANDRGDAIAAAIRKLTG